MDNHRIIFLMKNELFTDQVKTTLRDKNVALSKSASKGQIHEYIISQTWWRPVYRMGMPEGLGPWLMQKQPKIFKA